jgi:tetratricopeptide (TPR) repeat protein
MIPLILLAAVLLQTSSQASHPSHRSELIPLEILRRPIALRAGIGHAHDTAATSSPDAQALYDQGLAYLHAHVWIDAARSFNAALRIDPTFALAHVGLSVAYVELSRPADARAAIDASALLSLQGEFNLRTAERAKGRATLEEVVTRVRRLPGPDAWGQALFTLEAIARAARAVGDWELAARIARQMVEHDPSYAGSHYALGLVAEHDGDTAAAKAAFTAALERWGKADADLPELLEIRRKLR